MGRLSRPFCAGFWGKMLLSFDVRHHLTSLVTGRRPGLFRLRSGQFVEGEFRRVYAEASYSKTRPVLVIGAAAIFLSLIVAVMRESLSWQTAAVMLCVMLPTLMATLVASYKEGSHVAYQALLALTALWIGLFCTSLTVRASLHGAPYYFGAEVAWIFLVWLVLGLHFWYAAAVALTISAMYVWGMVHWQIPVQEALFSGLTLLAVNLIGAYCCFQLESAVRQAFLESRMLNDLAERDGLTGLYNRRRYDRDVEKLWRQSRRDQSRLTLLLVDIDHFKAFNDLYGHQAGDEALKRVAAVMATCAQRPLDFAARFGGEEFALVLYGPAQDFGREIPEMLRRSVEEQKIPHAESTTGPWLTVSVGVAIVSPGNERSLAGAIQLADEALYQAKEDGRNRIVVKESKNAYLQTGRFRAAPAKAGA
ncbi:MAG: GGDEF domain-containing protein [Gammaproteobacteria bacterium]|nr:GGDEF domain-containing protein [Gammaproteobacteria bacterium]